MTDTPQTSVRRRSQHYYLIRSAVRVIFYLLIALVMVLILGLANDQSANGAGSREYQRAERLIHHVHLTVPWDGRVSYSERTELCVEAFNGTGDDIRWHYLVAPGMYLKVCANGRYWVHDGVPFKHMHQW